MQSNSRPTKPFPAAEYAARLRRVGRHLLQQKLDAALFTTDISRFYLTGFECTNGLLVAGARQPPAFYTDFRYLEMARTSLPFVPVRRLARGAALPDQYAKLASAGGWRRVGYEGAITSSALCNLRKAMPKVEEWIDLTQTLDTLRAIKSPREQAVMRNAIRAGDDLLQHVMRELRPGMTEWEIRRLIRSWADLLSQGESFPSVVCAGSNASRCHHHPSERRLRRGQELLLDLGVVVDGYHSDMTRTLFCGTPSRKLREIYGIVLKANLAAVSVIRAGRTCSAVDATARSLIEKAGYGKCFGHGLGHSVGLAIHEWPGFTADCQAVLQPGMILTVEPGIYLPGVGGVRIEDMILVCRNGCEVLTRTPRTIESMTF